MTTLKEKLTIMSAMNTSNERHVAFQMADLEPFHGTCSLRSRE